MNVCKLSAGTFETVSDKMVKDRPLAVCFQETRLEEGEITMMKGLFKGIGYDYISGGTPSGGGRELTAVAVRAEANAKRINMGIINGRATACLLYTSPSPRD